MNFSGANNERVQIDRRMKWNWKSRRNDNMKVPLWMLTLVKIRKRAREKMENVKSESHSIPGKWSKESLSWQWYWPETQNTILMGGSSKLKWNLDFFLKLNHSISLVKTEKKTLNSSVSPFPTVDRLTLLIPFSRDIQIGSVTLPCEKNINGPSNFWNLSDRPTEQMRILFNFIQWK